MDEKKRLWLERGKSLLILCLACSAVTLTVLAQQSAGVGGDLVTRIYQTISGSGPVLSENVWLVEAVQPVRIVVTTGAGRYSVQYSNEQVDEIFSAVSPLLNESAAAGDTVQAGTTEGWMNALQRPGFCFDFLGAVPLDALTVTSGLEEKTAEQQSARRAVLCQGETGAELWYWNEEDETPYYCQLSGNVAEELESLLERYTTHDDGSFYAFEQPGYEALSPWQLLTDRTYEPKVYQAANPLSLNGDLVDSLVQTVGFNPHSLYVVNGDWVVKEGSGTLRIRSNGEAVYKAGTESGTSRLPVETAGESATRAEAVESARELVQQTLGSVQSAARIYLISCESSGNTQTVHFGYQLDGAAVELDGSPVCAEVVVEGRRISSFTMRYRSYTADEGTTPLMPERQAIAAMTSQYTGVKELLIWYTDDGTGSAVEASWAVYSQEED